MKKILLTAAILLSCLTVKIAQAQVSVGASINIGSQPDWGPTGYDYANYYYLPDINAYYDVPTHEYVYYDDNVWVHRAYLPYRYRNYDLYSGYKVVINERDPWVRNNVYRTRYASYRGRHDQVIIRNSHDARYAHHWTGNRGNNHYANHRSTYRARSYGNHGNVRGHNYANHGRPANHGNSFSHNRGPVNHGGGRPANHAAFNHGGGRPNGGQPRGGGFHGGGQPHGGGGFSHGGGQPHGGGGQPHGGGGHGGGDHGHHGH